MTMLVLCEVVKKHRKDENTQKSIFKFDSLNILQNSHQHVKIFYTRILTRVQEKLFIMLPSVLSMKQFESIILNDFHHGLSIPIHPIKYQLFLHLYNWITILYNQQFIFIFEFYFLSFKMMIISRNNRTTCLTCVFTNIYSKVFQCCYFSF